MAYVRTNNKTFSVSIIRKVIFSPGNLQYQPTSRMWRFASSQCECIGLSNKNLSPFYSGWIDLFGWSGRDGAVKFGVSTSLDSSAYLGSFVDWGTNKIGFDSVNTWRTLTTNEWNFLLGERRNASMLYGIAEVNGVNGLVLLPDAWTAPYGIIFNPGCSSVYSIEAFGQYQKFNSSQWSLLEGSGAVFLPAAGERCGSEVTNVNQFGVYHSWDPDLCREYSAHSLIFNSGYVVPTNSPNIFYGASVRLVKNV